MKLKKLQSLLKKGLALLTFFLTLTGGTMNSFGGCLEDAAVRYGVSPLLLEAIALVESGANPFTVGIKAEPKEAQLLRKLFDEAGVPYVLTKQSNYWVLSVFPESQGRASWVIKVAADLAVTYDAGLMQINKLWIDRYNLEPEWLLDKCYAYEWGAFVLSRMIKRYGYSWEAIWHYNGRRDYAVKVFRKVKKLCRERYRSEPYCKRFN